MKHALFTRAYITGGSSGIGFAVACECVRQGAEVVLIARDREKIDRAVRRLEALKLRDTQRILGLSLDVSAQDLVAARLGETVESFGAPDLIVNCAGMPLAANWRDVSPARFAELVATNLNGAWNVIHALLPRIKRPGGAVVNVSSGAGFVGTFGYTAYSGSKFGLVGLSEALRAELRPEGVHVAVLCPPDTDTPQLAAERAVMPAETRAVTGSGGMLTPEAVARALFRGLRRKRFMIIPGSEAKFVYTMKRLFPGVVIALMDRDIKRGRKQHG